MLRTVAAVVAGYVALVVVVFAGLTLAYVVLGADLSFREGGYDVSLLWILVSIVVGFAAALFGGWVARRIARSRTGPRALAVVVVVLGLVLAIPVLFGTIDGVAVRTGSVDAMEAMRQARTPLWIMLLNPLIGALGVLVGGGVLGRRDETPPVDQRAD